MRDGLKILYGIAIFLVLFFGPFICLWMLNTLVLAHIPGAMLIPYLFGTEEWLAMLILVSGSVLAVVTEKH